MESAIAPITVNSGYAYSFNKETTTAMASLCQVASVEYPEGDKGLQFPNLWHWNIFKTFENLLLVFTVITVLVLQSRSPYMYAGIHICT